jgi:hypothetical protein
MHQRRTWPCWFRVFSLIVSILVHDTQLPPNFHPTASPLWQRGFSRVDDLVAWIVQLQAEGSNHNDSQVGVGVWLRLYQIRDWRKPRNRVIRIL